MGQALGNSASEGGEAVEPTALEVERQQKRLRALGVDDMSSLTYFAFSLCALFEGMAARIRFGGMVETLDGLVKKRQLWEQSSQLELPAGAVLLASIGFLRCLQKDPRGALQEYAQALQIRRRTNTMGTSDGAFLLTSIGIAKCSCDDHEGAAAAFQEAFRIRELTDTMDTPDGAVLWTCKGFARWAAHDLQGCIEAYKTARRLRAEFGMLETVDGVRLLTNLGAAQLESEDHEGSVRTFKEARTMRVRLGEHETVDGARLVVNVGAAEFVLGRLQKSLATYAEARRALERADGPHSRDLAGLAANVGLAEHMQGNLPRACEAYEESLRRLEARCVMETPTGSRVLMSLALARLEREEPRNAYEAFQRARRCCEETALESPWTTALLSVVASHREEKGNVWGALEVLEAEREARRHADTLGSAKGQELERRIEALTQRCATLPCKAAASEEEEGDEETCASERDMERGPARGGSKAKGYGEHRTWPEKTGESEFDEVAVEELESIYAVVTTTVTV